MRIFKKINHVYVEKSGHLIILSDDKPQHGEWAFDLRPDEHGIMHQVCYVKQAELTMFDTSTERRILASNKLPCKKVLLIPEHQEKLIRERYSDGIPCDIMIEYEEYAEGSYGLSDGEPTICERIKIIDGVCNIREVVWNKSQLDFELNHILNDALVSSRRIKNPDSNKIADFINQWLERKYNIKPE